MRPLATLGLVFMLALALKPASAAESKIFLSGHMWEEGGFPPSLPNDELQVVGMINSIRQPLFWSPSVYSYTWYAHGLISTGSVVYGSTHITEYIGGEISIHVDTLPSNATYGTWPNNSTAPSTFTDGHAVYLQGKFQSCTVTFNTNNLSGSFVGEVVFNSGNAYPQLQSANGWAIGSTISGLSPAGYSGALNGSLYVNGPTELAARSWGQVKSLYR